MPARRNPLTINEPDLNVYVTKLHVSPGILSVGLRRKIPRPDEGNWSHSKMQRNAVHGTPLTITFMLRAALFRFTTVRATVFNATPQALEKSLEWSLDFKKK